MKDEIELRKQRNIAELSEVDEVTRLEMEGFRGGTYLRLELHGMPCELVRHFDPRHPLLVGGIPSAEEGVGYMQVRLALSVVVQRNFELLVTLFNGTGTTKATQMAQKNTEEPRSNYCFSRMAAVPNSANLLYRR